MARRAKGPVAYPAALEHVWNWFCAVAATRGNNGFGLLPISYGEIAAWAALSRAEPTPWEISLIREIDAAVLAILNAKKDDREPEIEVAADDIAGVRTVMGALKARSRAVFGKKAANDPAKRPA
ncbi:hypothetical protein ABID82_002286 [Methylobacterium sp. PvP062]|uniref:Uncharacterized protein n=1 Tax=Methylobacterium radiotolerans TaxID=31998 RepID=A0ABV2NN10_9HYPH|nr:MULTISPECIES: hypothetical protein [unclassified Methylobacterium]MBP2495381.1 hypothetical protein [Methylobacterium sp. PvP105]MBP2504748.1 hypothetical protein [Methylobacterium sp. PvP109]MCX7335758.1 hypothetical protein [Hyphomicrobiales bacterium]